VKINLLAPEMQPKRPSPVPYMPLIGLAIIGAIWLITQFAVAAGARSVAAGDRKEYERIIRELVPTRAALAELEKAKPEHEALCMKAAAVAALTSNVCPFAPILHTWGRHLPASLRITELTLDRGKGIANLTGYGSADDTELQVAVFVRHLNSSQDLTPFFEKAVLNYCRSVERGPLPVKEFGVSLVFRGRFRKHHLTAQDADGK
jgi:hypothetical protein